MFGRPHRGAARLGAAALIATTALLTAAVPAAADTTPIGSRQYTVQVQTFRSIQETQDAGGDFLSSDEIYAGFRITLSGGSTTAVQSRLIGDFDTGESKSLANDQNCLTPADVRTDNGAGYLSGFSNDHWVCDPGGATAPFSITARVVESTRPAAARPAVPRCPRRRPWTSGAPGTTTSARGRSPSPARDSPPISRSRGWSSVTRSSTEPAPAASVPTASPMW
jgi:hypothetical protein